MNKKVIAAEHITQGHPDKVADAISDALVTAYFAQDPKAHVAIETLVTTNTVIIAGEVKSTVDVDKDAIIRKAIKSIGYVVPGIGFDADTVHITDLTHSQSADIDMGVSRKVEEEQGAGDQGFMIGYASSQTRDYMPLPIALAKALTDALVLARESNSDSVLLPDGKSQVSIIFEDGTNPVLQSVLVSSHHLDVDTKIVHEEIMHNVITPTLEYFNLEKAEDFQIFINPTGRFVIGGPDGDTGVTGRKIVADQYGPACPVGGGAFSGKDASKVDRSGAYAARWVAKNIVAAELADECEVQIAYAIGVAEPTSIYVDTKGTAKKVSDEKLSEIVKEVFDLRPFAIVRDLNLLNVDYNEVQRIGTFGNTIHPWEQTNRIDDLLKALNY